MSDLINRLNAALEGRYRIERELGEGGMASVYLADDRRHDRKVALKVLKPELAAVVGGERFLAEIKTTANLHHPHILPLFDSGEADGFLFYVMPYVEGESLRERLERERQLPVETAVELARKVADALDYAHERGVVHRDVKPANILLSERGEPLVADFGIALAVRQAGGGRITETGLSLGTPHYMSPEQASGDQTVDRRTDVYALACVLYEMLAGEPPYAGTTSQAVLAKILTTDPGRVSEVRRAVPAHVDAAVAKALEKLPADRFGSAGAFGEALDDVSFRHALRPAHGAAGTGGSERRTGPLSRWSTVQVGSVATGLVAGALLTMAGFALLEPDGGSEARSGAIPTSRFVVELGGHTIRQSQFDLSADGRMFVYATEDDREPLYIRTMDDPEPRPIAGTEGADWPVFSPDGQWIAYRDDDDALRRVAIGGGAPLRITTGRSTPIAPHWGEDGTLVFQQQDGLYQVAARGGDPEKLLDGSAPFQLRFPRLLPGGEALLFTEVEGFGERGAVFLLDMESRETTPLIQEGLDARYVETGHIVYGHPGGSLFALPFDLESLEAIGDPVPVLDGVRVVPGVLATAFAASRIGTVAYLRGRGPGIAADILVMADSAGDWEPLPLESPLLWAPRFSPDGRRLAYEDQEQIRVHDVVLGTNLRITQEGRHNLPVWTPRGDSLVFASEVPGADGFDLYVASADGEGEPRLLWSEEGSQYPESWDPQGARLLYTSRSEDGNEDLEILDLSGEPETMPYLTADWDEYRGRISPDGRWVAYDSDEDGTNRIYVRAFPEPGAQWVVSEGAGESSRWSPDGETLYYWRADTLVAARVRTEPSFQVLSRSDVPVGRYDEEYDVRPDGSGFVFSGPLPQSSDSAAGDEEEGDGSAELVVVVNWFDELMERAGVRRGGR